ncbi:MAG TPA: class I SAM-dependent methyltransferase [Kofleriaceae bacterium]|nr:class I SAM-dependent methyltransferase [Kofleriaceae bacterium]
MESIAVLDPRSDHYIEVFELLIRRGDEKANLISRLRELAGQLPDRRLLVDAGAGLGSIVAALQGEFARAIAVEPAPLMAAHLRMTYPALEVIPARILEAPVAPGAADLIVCAHVFYYIDRAEWPVHLEKLLSWLAPQGVLAISLSHPDAQCMKIHEDFHRVRVDLRPLAAVAQEMAGGPYEAAIETIPARYTTSSLAEMCRIAEFMVTWAPGPELPSSSAIEAYVRRHLTCPEHGYCLSCDNVMIRIRRRPSSQG